MLPAVLFRREIARANFVRVARRDAKALLEKQAKKKEQAASAAGAPAPGATAPVVKKKAAPKKADDSLADMLSSGLKGKKK